MSRIARFFHLKFQCEQLAWPEGELLALAGQADTEDEKQKILDAAAAIADARESLTAASLMALGDDLSPMLQASIERVAKEEHA